MTSQNRHGSSRRMLVMASQFHLHGSDPRGCCDCSDGVPCIRVMTAVARLRGTRRWSHLRSCVHQDRSHVPGELYSAHPFTLGAVRGLAIEPSGVRSVARMICVRCTVTRNSRRTGATTARARFTFRSTLPAWICATAAVTTTARLNGKTDPVDRRQPRLCSGPGPWRRSPLIRRHSASDSELTRRREHEVQRMERTPWTRSTDVSTMVAPQRQRSPFSSLCSLPFFTLLFRASRVPEVRGILRLPSIAIRRSPVRTTNAAVPCRY